jgi:hypothetical protein
MQHHTCPHCGTDFETSSWNQSYCSRSCWLAENIDKVKAIKRQSAARLHPSKPLQQKDCAHCGNPFTTRISWQAFCSEKCRANAHYRRHKPRYTAYTKLYRKAKPEKARAACKRHHAKYSSRENAKTRQRYMRRTTQALRLKNLEGVDLKTGLRISLVAHRFLQNVTPYAMRNDIYPDSADSHDAIKKIIKNHQARIEAEKQRISALSFDQRQDEAVELLTRLSSTLAI